MKKLLSIVLGAVMVPAVAFSQVAALAAGQIEGGDIYRVKNVTKMTDFTDPVSAVCGDTVQFKVRIHNPGPDALTGVKVSATLPAAAATSHSSKVTVSADNANPTSVSDTAGVNLSTAGKLAYVAGSTELLDAHNAKLQTLADGIVGGSVAVPNGVGVSTEQKRFVQFQAKVECETPPTPKNITVCDLATKNIITIREDQFDASKHSKDLAKCAETPAPGQITVCDLTTKKVVNIKETEFDSNKHSKDLNKCAQVLAAAPATIASTGPASAIATMFGLSALAAGIGYAVQQRRNILG